MPDETLLTFVADIVSAHVSNNAVKPSELPQLIESIYASLEGLGKPVVVAEEKREPAVSIRSSIKPDAIICLECGERMKMLKRHLGTDHNLTPAEYKARWGLNADYPLVAPEYAAMRRKIATKIGLGRKLGANVKPGAKGKPAAVRKLKVVKAASEASEV
jgi:predicted transcriptional regulator